jgi:hypothetical protein
LKELFLVNDKNTPFYAVVYTLHELMKKRKYDELVTAMVQCRPTPSTVLKYEKR